MCAKWNNVKMAKPFLLFGVILVITIVAITTLIIVQDESNNFANPEFLQRLSIKTNFQNCIDYDSQNGDNIIIDPVEEPVENLPRVYLQQNAKLPQQYNSTCAKFPQLFGIKYWGDYWQVQNSTNGTLHLYSAYIDDRREPWTVRIMSVYDQFYSNDSFYCQFWYDGAKEPVFAKSEQVTWIWIKGWGGNRPGIYHPYLISCPLPDNNKVPMSVSVVEHQCDNPTNNLRISYQKADPDSKKNFLVCVKGLNFPFNEGQTYRLVEWIELLLLLGADKINFYEFNVHPKIQILLDYYIKQSKVELTPISLVGGVSNSPYLQSKFLKQMVIHRRLQEVIPYNDCFYKHRHEYKFVVLLDTDEVIVPLNGTWVDMMNLIYNENKTSYMARNIYFLDNYEHDHEWFEGIPKFMHMLQHIYRSEEYTAPGAYVKGLHDTRRILTLHNHFAFKCLDGCKASGIDTNIAHLQHYRSDCVKELKNCDEMKKNYVMDNRLWRFKDELIGRVLHVLTSLGMVNVTDV